MRTLRKLREYESLYRFRGVGDGCTSWDEVLDRIASAREDILYLKEIGARILHNQDDHLYHSIPPAAVAAFCKRYKCGRPDLEPILGEPEAPFAPAAPQRPPTRRSTEPAHPRKSGGFVRKARPSR
jgi:hypothetical protein